MGTRVAVGGVFALAMLAMALLQPVSALRVMTGEGELLLCARLGDGETVALSFTHSMYGGFVRETYVVDDEGRLVRQRIVTENAAAAEYYATDGRVREMPDGYEVVAGPFATDELVIRVDGIGNHRLTAGASSWPLFEIFGEPVQVRISGDRTPRIRLPDGCVASEADLATTATVGLVASVPPHLVCGVRRRRQRPAAASRPNGLGRAPAVRKQSAREVLRGLFA